MVNIKKKTGEIGRKSFFVELASKEGSISNPRKQKSKERNTKY